MKEPQRENRNIGIEVIHEFSRGSEIAARQIYEHFSPAVYGIVAATPLMLEDIRPEIVEQVFTQLWIDRAAITSNTIEHFRSHLFSVTKNAIVDYLQDLHYNQLEWVKGMKEGKKRWKFHECEDCSYWEQIHERVLSSDANIGEMLRLTEQSSLGNQDAYKKVCDHFHSFGYRLARKYLDSPSKIMIENIVKEAFSNIWIDRHKLDLLKWPLKFEFYLDRYVKSAALKTLN